MNKEEWEKHKAKIAFDVITCMLGIDISLWYYAQGNESTDKHGKKVTVYYGNEKVEDITMMIEFIQASENNLWVLETFEMDLD